MREDFKDKTLLCIDPGPEKSGWAFMHGKEVLASGVDKNERLLKIVGYEPFMDRDRIGFDIPHYDHLAIEMIEGRGMPVDQGTFDTAMWVGRFIQKAVSQKKGFDRLFRRHIKLHLCGQARAKDPNVRQAIIDLYPPVGGGSKPQIGTKKEPGPLYGVSSHAWSALAVGLTFLEVIE